MAGSDKRHKIKLGPVELDYARFGKGPALLVLHGGGGPIEETPVVRRLAETFDVIAPVHPGFDGTRIPDHFDNVQDLVVLYLDLADALDLRDAVLMGMSLGGWVAAELATLTTARFRKLVLVDAVGIKPGDRETRDVADIFGMPGPALDRILWHDPKNAPDLTKLPDEKVAMLAGNRTALGAYSWDPYMHNPKLRHRLHRIKIPTLLVWGASDGVVTPHYGAAFRDLINGATLTVIPEAGHMPHLEQPEAFLKAVLPFSARKAAS